MRNFDHSRPIGKKVKGALYVHRESLSFMDTFYSGILGEVLSTFSEVPNFNVIKFTPKSVSLLLYEDFAEHAFPSLLYSYHIRLDDKSVSFRNYESRDNPPILHRKELLLPPSHSKLPEYYAITRIAEKYNLFSNVRSIGFKRQWRELVENANLEIIGPRLVEKKDAVTSVSRHKTALVRRDLSQPVQLLLTNGVLDRSRSFFDYGCGQGTDLEALTLSGFEAFGWDPHHFPNGRRELADVVNLGFVLNVIEDPFERLETLKSAWSFTKKALCISVMISGKIDLSKYKAFGDGIITSRNTFQKYFNQQELRDFIVENIGVQPISLGSGIVVAFKDKILEQNIVYNKSLRAFSSISDITVPRRIEKKDNFSIILEERLSFEIEILWKYSLQKGRVLEIRDFPIELADSLKEKNVSTLRFLNFVKSRFENDTQLKLSAEMRREDIILKLALTLFPGIPQDNILSNDFLRDIRFFFGSQRNALLIAKEKLFALGNPVKVNQAIDFCVGSRIGAIVNGDFLRFQQEFLGSLPLELRLLVGCATILRGSLDGVDFIDIKSDGKRVDFLTCYDPKLHFPVVSERNRVDLQAARSKVDFPKGMVIYNKSKLMSSGDPQFQRQVKIDQKLSKLGIIDDKFNGPDWYTLKKMLLEKKDNLTNF
jgi:DNA phosphorothioation-associated putative methyltransferase